MGSVQMETSSQTQKLNNLVKKALDQQGMLAALYYKVYKQRRATELEKKALIIAKKRYMKSNNWKRLRQQVLGRAGYTCTARMAGCTLTATEVHHISYINLGDEPLWDLRAVCSSCHAAVHKVRQARF
jgi:5-methylcytosine-specific restriction endonuclease McrA